MADLGATEKAINAGDHQVDVTLNGGTAKLQIKTADDAGFKDLIRNSAGDVAYTVDAMDIFTLRKCELKAILTGGATITIGASDHGVLE